ncbi:60S ribosomal protein L36a [Lemmus lemmus]
MVRIPKTRWMFCKKCGKLQPHKVTQYKSKDSLCAQKKQCYHRKQNGYGGQTKPLFLQHLKYECESHDWQLLHLLPFLYQN